MSHIYSERKSKFDSWNNDASEFINGEAKLDSADSVNVNEVWTVLIKTSEVDSMTKELSQLLFGSFSITTQRMLIDHLPEGKHHSDDAKLKEEISSVPTTNVAPERDFAVLHRLLHQRPNAMSVALKAMILFSHNKLQADQIIKVAKTINSYFK